MNKFIPLLSLGLVASLSAQIRVGDFPTLTGAGVDLDNDQFIIRDVSVPGLKKITGAQLKIALGATVPTWDSITGKPTFGTSSGYDTGITAGTVLLLGTGGTVPSGITWAGEDITDGYIASAATWNAKQSALTFGTGVVAALAVNIGSAGAVQLNNGSGTSLTALNGSNISSGTVAGAYGGTGVANTGKTITLGGNLTTTGAFNTTLAQSGSYTLTLAGTSAINQGVQTTDSPTFAGLLLTAGGFTTTLAASFGNLTLSGEYRAPSGDFSSLKVGQYSTGSGVYLERDAANTLAQRNGTSSQLARIYNTYTSTSNQEMLETKGQAAGSFVMQSIKGSSGGTARDIEFRYGGTNTAGTVTNGTLVAAATSQGFAITPAASSTPATNGQLTFEATSNTSLTVKLKGTDGTVRSVVLTLAP